TLNPFVEGSIPSRPTTYSIETRHLELCSRCLFLFPKTRFALQHGSMPDDGWRQCRSSVRIWNLSCRTSISSWDAAKTLTVTTIQQAEE
ncbi:MAG: hypothetical protein KBA32_16430, partial [Propionivibrio sp.]|uniref:hypothetical protein n=1 Tax=Propionivibrio sp. TaxID=2212460 RepID=UPI001B4FBDDC